MASSDSVMRAAARSKVALGLGPAAGRRASVHADAVIVETCGG